MMILYTSNEIRLENKIHKYIEKKYKRIGRLEIFEIDSSEHKKILKKI